MRTLLLVPVLLAFIVMGIGTHAHQPNSWDELLCAPCFPYKPHSVTGTLSIPISVTLATNCNQLRDVEITIASWVGAQMNGSIPVGNATAVVNLIADCANSLDSAACVILRAKTPGKLRIRYGTDCLQVVAATDGPTILDPMPTPCPPSPSPSQTPAQVTLTVTAAPAGKASVSWQLTAAPGNQDWIGMYLASEPNGSTKFISGKWVYVTTQTGTFTTDAPANGSYEWRYLLTNRYQNVARSAAFVVGPGPTPSPTPTPEIDPTPSPTPTPTPSSVAYDFARFDILGKTVIEQDDILAAAGDQGYGKCFSIVLARYFYCFRVQGSTTKFEWKRFPWVNGQPQRDALSTQVGQEGFSNVFPWAGYLRASKPKP